MIYLHQSHQLKILAKKLADLLGQNQPDDPLEPHQIIVPNLDTSRWLKIFIAESTGISANTRFLLPSEWQWNQIRKLYPMLPALLPSDPGPMKWAIFEILSDPKILDTFSNLKSYVATRGDEAKDASILQLAGQLSYIFDQYQVYRPGMMVKWQKGYSGTANGDEAWQSELWRLFDKKMKILHAGESGLNRAELFMKVIEVSTDTDTQTDGSPLFVFNPGLIPETIISLMEKAGERSELHLFHVRPTSATDEYRNEILQAFGDEAGRVNSLLEFGTAEVSRDFSLIDEGLDLGAIREAVIKNEPLRKAEKSSEELTGIVIKSCHSAIREVETLHHFLLERFEGDENLHPDDVLVVTPDPDLFESAIHSVFGVQEKGLPQIPYHISGRRSAGEYSIVQAFTHLLNTADSRFAFSDVMDLFSMRPVYERFDVSEADTELVRSWMEENHVVWGLSPEHRAEWNQPAEELQTWQNALRRGWLGQWLDAGENNMANDILLFRDVDSVSLQKIWAAFSGYLNRLGRFGIGAKEPRSITDWADFLNLWMGHFFSDKSLHEPEALQLKRVLETMKEASELVRCQEKIGFADFRSEIVNNMKQAGAGSANFNRGVVFSSMVPVRSIPFKIIALIGLNEQTFPRKSTVREFDLMALKPKTHDRNRKEEDRNLFLESIIAAQQVHYCSYTGQSQVDNETIPPSSIVSEWVEILSIYSGLKPDEIITKEPLTSFSASRFMQGVNYSEISLQTAKNILDDSQKVSGLQSGPLPAQESDGRISVDDFVHFFGNPVQWFMSRRFGARLRDAGGEKEEFDIDNLENHLLFQRVFGWSFSGMKQEVMENLLIQSGALPAGYTGRKRLTNILDQVNSCNLKIREYGFDPVTSYIDLSIILNNNVISGSIQTYYKKGFLDITVSELSGRFVIQVWIKHLLLSVSGGINGESYLLANVKKGNPKLLRFAPADNAETLLENYLDLYLSGSRQPEYFFPKTLYAYTAREREGKPDAWQQAVKAFEGDEYSFPERQNEYISWMMGEDVKMNSSFLDERYQSLVKHAVDHMEEVK